MNIIKFLKRKNNEYKIGIVEEFVLMVSACILCLVLGFNLSSKKSVKEVKYDDILTTFIDNYNYIVDNYYKKVDKKQLIDDAIAGMMKTLDDPYSVYLNDEENRSINITLNGKYQGLGLMIGKKSDGNIVVAGVFKESPADMAGILEGDIIIKLDDKDVSSMDVSEFSNYVAKSENTEFKLTLLRDSENKEITVSKNNVEIDSVYSNTIDYNNKKVGYIYISLFAANTYEQFSNKLTEF